MVGRDIGTVVLKDAPVKAFLVASVEIRAKRRHAEAVLKIPSLDIKQVQVDLERRDNIDSERSESPLKPAADAVVIDTDGMSIDDVANRILAMVARY